MTDVKVVSEILKPYDALTMRCYPVSPRLNHVVNDDAACSTVSRNPTLTIWGVNVWFYKRLTVGESFTSLLR
jgi:hypothetical protein